MAARDSYAFHPLDDRLEREDRSHMSATSTDGVWTDHVASSLPSISPMASRNSDGPAQAYKDQPQSGERSPFHVLEVADGYSSPMSRGRVHTKCWPKLPEWWYWEIAAVVLSGVCLSLVVAILVFLHEKSYSSWPYRGISPNALISTITTIGKAAMLVPVAACLSQLKWNHYVERKPLHHLQILNEASRGPYGALQMLCSMAPSLATVGAVLIILSLAMDPFAQQILRYPPRTVIVQNTTASAQIAQIYHPEWLDWTSGSPFLSEALFGNQLDPSMQIAILNGLFQANTPLRPVCPTGKCEYPDFVTLGFCSQCRDVTDGTKQQCAPSRNVINTAGSSDRPNMNPDDPTFMKSPLNCTYTLPSGISITPNWKQNSGSNGSFALLHRDPWTSVAIAPFLMPNKGVSTIAGIQDPIVGFGSAKYSTELYYTSDNVTAVEQKPNLTECALYFCEKKYEQNSVSLAQPYLDTSRTQRLFLEGRGEFSGDSGLVIDPLIPPNDTHTLSPNSTYIFDHSTFLSLTQMLENLLNTTTAWMYYFDGSNNYIASGFSAAAVLYRSEDLGLTMEHLATSMTDNVRTCKTAMQVNGTALVEETYIHVRWEWIILPAALTVLSAAFLAVTIVANSRQHGILWKSNELALLLREVKGRPGREDLGLLRDVSQMNEVAKEMVVSMEQDKDQRLAFVES